MNHTMPPKAPTIVVCPVCDAEGSTLHHDVRAPLNYSCPRCLHEWQLDPDEKVLAEDEPAPVELVSAQAPLTKPSR